MHSVNSIMIYRTVVKPYFVSIFTYSRNQCISVSGRRRGRQLQFSTLLVGEERARALQKLTAPGGPFTWMEVGANAYLFYLMESSNFYANFIFDRTLLDEMPSRKRIILLILLRRGSG